jgi:hypothetical protein
MCPERESWVKTLRWRLFGMNGREALLLIVLGPAMVPFWLGALFGGNARVLGSTSLALLIGLLIFFLPCVLHRSRKIRDVGRRIARARVFDSTSGPRHSK